MNKTKITKIETVRGLDKNQRLQEARAQVKRTLLRDIDSMSDENKEVMERLYSTPIEDGAHAEGTLREMMIEETEQALRECFEL